LLPLPFFFLSLQQGSSCKFSLATLKIKRACFCDFLLLLQLL
jgi:hypothetical protein